MLQGTWFFIIIPTVNALGFYEIQRKSEVNRGMRNGLLNADDRRHGGIKMGVPDDFCDNGKNNLDVDWNMKDNSLYSCTIPFEVPFFLEGKSYWHCTEKEYEPRHKCMNETITYQEIIPLSGAHRPLWPAYGEYLYLPPQRWVHSLEHGALVMLYHPCADREQVAFLRSIVRICIRRHIITPYNKLPLSEPLALVTYKCRLTMGHVDKNRVVDFIKGTALQAPESSVWKDGDYSFGIFNHSKPLNGSDVYDSNICPTITRASKQ